MPRPSKPYYHAGKKRWLATIDGRKVTLGKTRKEANEKFHSLMSGTTSVASEITTIYALSQEYLKWVEANREESTFQKKLRSLKSFVGHAGKRLKISNLKGHHLTQWILANPDWKSTTTQNLNVRSVIEMLNWATCEGYIQHSPLNGYKKPPENSRDIYYTDEQRREILAAASPDSFRLFLEFLMETGCRPGEARVLRVRHLVDGVLAIPKEDHIKRQDRVIYPSDRALEILNGLKEGKGPDDYLFLSRLGCPNTKDTIRCGMDRIQDKIGWRPVAYGLRHTWCTNALMDGLDAVTVVTLMGHKDEKMVMRIYNKLTKNPEFMKEQANRVRRADELRSTSSSA